MEYELFIFSTLDVHHAAKKLIDMMKSILEREIEIVYGDDIYVGCGLFSFFIELEEYEDLDFIREYYEVDVNSRICIHVLNREFDEGIQEVFKIINYLLKLNNDNMLLLVNGAKQILRRDNGELIFNEIIEYIPYEKIDVPYRKEQLKKM